MRKIGVFLGNVIGFVGLLILAVVEEYEARHRSKED